MQKTIISILVLFISVNIGFTQVLSGTNSNQKLELKDKILKTAYKDTLNTDRLVTNKKNPAISIFLSLLLPGAGHLYADRMDVGKYFVISEASCWLGVLGMNLYGNWLRDDSRTFATEHAKLNKEGKDDDYFANVGNFSSIFEYNNEKLAKGEWDKLYDPNSHFWSWDSDINKSNFDLQRKKSERTYNARIIFATGLVVNRVVSAISALVLTNKNMNSSSGIRISSEFIGTPSNPYNGIKLNFVKSF